MPNPTSTCGCGRGWTGLVSAHCALCHRHFSTVKNFDLHRPRPRKSDGTPGCGDPATLTRRKQNGEVVPLLKPAKSVFGVTWVGYSEDARYAEAES